MHVSTAFTHEINGLHTSPVTYSLAIAFTALVFAVIALLCAGYSVMRAETKRLLELERRCYDLDSVVLGVGDQYAKILKMVDRINKRENARDRRRPNGRDPEMPDPQKDPAAWRAEMMRRYPRGALSAEEK